MNKLEDYIIDWKAPKSQIEKLFENYMDAFHIFCSEYNTHYGNIEIDDNLIEIHTGGWSYNEGLIEVLERTVFWMRIHKIVVDGGHYYIDLDRHNYDKKHFEITIN